MQTITGLMTQYPLQVKSIKLISDKGKKATWSLATSTGTKILKKTPVSKQRLLFLLQAIRHLQKNGAPIPRMVATKDGNDYAEDSSGNCYVLSDAAEGNSPSYVTSDLLLIMKELGKFHLASRGFQSAYTTNEREHLGSWGRGYAKHLDQLERFKGMARRSSSEFERLYLLHADKFIEQGKEALHLIQGSPYTNWVNKVAIQKNLCHQDFAAANLIKTRQGLAIIDMDSLTFDLPARDIRKIFNKVMKKHGWSSSKAISMLRAYREVHPLSAEECSVIYADLLFPHLFYGLSSKYFNRRTEWNAPQTIQKLKSLITTDRERQQMLASWGSIINQS
ncbi:spore coat-associated protein S [Paenibacillus algorifonticola]|uniref:Spore coat-associated protein S n=1 Tax=Paenibacillus algorifonticola TaxID=684063 RepID=A0A1I2HVA2_9BACL|nr:CotS family spore coat protein [Paenibacillus algorifonticola]SFF32667.1 spore coat-associated protein S [Paenibacillus algorifonticola]